MRNYNYWRKTYLIFDFTWLKPNLALVHLSKERKTKNYVTQSLQVKRQLKKKDEVYALNSYWQSHKVHKVEPRTDLISPVGQLKA